MSPPDVEVEPAREVCARSQRSNPDEAKPGSTLRVREGCREGNEVALTRSPVLCVREDKRTPGRPKEGARIRLRARCREGRELELAGTDLLRANSLSHLQSARLVTTVGDRLTLIDVSPQTVWFMSHPSHGAGRDATERFVASWAEGVRSFQRQPPTAQLTCMSAAGLENALVLLSEPFYSPVAATLEYRLLEGSEDLPAACSEVSLRIPDSRVAAVAGTNGNAVQNVWFLDLTSATMATFLNAPQSFVAAGGGVIGAFSTAQIDALTSGAAQYTVGLTQPIQPSWWDHLDLSQPLTADAIFAQAFSPAGRTIVESLANVQGRVVLSLDLEVRDAPGVAWKAAVQTAAVLWAARQKLPNVPLYPVLGSSLSAGRSAGYPPNVFAGAAPQTDFLNALNHIPVSPAFTTAGIGDFASFLWSNALIDGIISEQYQRSDGNLAYLEDDPAAYTLPFDYVVMSSTVQNPDQSGCPAKYQPCFHLPTTHESAYCAGTPALRNWPGTRIDVGWKTAAYFTDASWNHTNRSLASVLSPVSNCPPP